MTRIKNSRQFKAERNKLRLKETEAKERIREEWKSLIGIFGFRRESSRKSREQNVPPHAAAGEDDSILGNTLAYAGALLGRKLGARMEEKLTDFFQQENDKD